GRKMEKDIRLYGTKQTTSNRVIQNGWSSIDQVVDYLEGFRYKPRSTSSIPSHQSEYRVSTLSGVQIREDRLQVLGDALRSSSRTSNIHENVQTCGNGIEKEMEITNIGICGRHSITELGLVDDETRDNGDHDLLEQSRIANSGGQELDGTQSGIRVSWLAMENKRDNLLANSGQEKMHAQGIKINDEQSKEQRKNSRKKTSKFNWRNLIYRCTMETRASTHKQLDHLKSKTTNKNGWNSLVKLTPQLMNDLSWWFNKMSNNSNRCLQERLGSNAEDPITREKNSMGMLENCQVHIIQLERATS
ncbi:MAG: hypothetical protein EZS28_051039, partial [Streblomastix strix]